MKITEVCVRKPVLAWMMMIATVVFGLVSASRIGVSQFPDVDFPTITVSLDWPGATPDAVEQDVVEVVEEAVMQVEGVKSVTSSSQQGRGRVTIELDLSRNVDVALQDVQTKVAGVQRRLPKDLEPPSVSKTNPEDQPIMWVGLSGPFSRQVLSDLARYRVKDAIQTVPGVGEVILGGYAERNVRVWVNSDWLAEKHLTVSDVVRALQREHVEMPAGQLQTEGREVNVRVLGEALDLEQLRNIVVREVDGQPVYLHQVALIEDGFEDIRSTARAMGEPAQGMGIKKQRGSNAVAVAKGVRQRMAEIQKTLPEGMEFAINFDSSKYIEESVTHIEWELILAVLLTALVCWVFLGSISSTVNVVLAIPMSLLGTIAIIYFLGFTLNTFTLLALSLCVGIVVDDAIMIMENIFRHAEEGKPMKQAALDGTREIAFAALAATTAVIAIFVPVVFMEGVIGRFFLQFGVTLSIAVALSYIEAVTLAPARCAQMLSASEHRNALGRVMDRAFDSLKGGYQRVLNASLRVPALTLLVAALVFGASIYVLMTLPSEFVPSQDQSRLMVRMTTAVGSDINETDMLIRKAEAMVNKKPEIERAFVSVGGFGGAGVNSGVMFVTMVPKDKRTVTQAEFAGTLRRELNSIPGLKAVVQDLSQQGFTSQRGFPVEFSLRGPDWEKLVEISADLREQLQASGLVVDLDTDYQVGQPELRVQPDRNLAADQHVSMDEIGQTLNSLVGGITVGKFSQNGRRVDVRMRLLAGQRSRPEDLKLLQVRSAEGRLLPLSGLVSQEERPALQSIIRRDRERAISVFANVAPGHNQSEALEFINNNLSQKLPEGYRVVLGGASVAYKDSFGSLLFALVLGIIVAYMVLASQFNSFLHPITVLTILPLSVAGAAFALLMFGLTLNIFSMIGLLLLMGIVKKNSIILIDYTLQLKATGLTPLQAVSRAAPIRLRPILMTSAATLMAAVPAAVGLGQGSEVRTPMAISVIGGVILSTILSLLVVPCFYVFTDRVQTRLIAVYRRIRQGKAAPQARQETPSEELPLDPQA